MVRIIAFLMAIFCAVQAMAQSDETTEKGRIETWLEDTLSAAGRDVRITGFSGAFSSEARFDTLSIADDDGIWFSIENATLNWSRSALLSGRVDINEIAADKISILRRPLPGPAISAEDSQSANFEVPDLPISLEIDKIDVASIQVDAVVLGQPLDLSLEGKAQLVGGQMAVDVQATRKGDLGRFALVANFANDTRQLDIDLTLQEARDGIVASLLGIPGAPELDMSVVGAAPLTGFTAELSLKTNQTEHIAGEVHYREAAPDIENATVFGASLAGDLRPLFASDFHPFFGAQSRINLEAARRADGILDINALNVETGVLAVQGDLALGADNLPNAFSLQAAIMADQPVRLPSKGAPITIGGLRLSAIFDAQRSNAWTTDVTLSELKHESLTVPKAKLTGRGTIDRSFGQQVTGDIAFSTEALGFTDEALAAAFNGAQSGRLVFDWSEGAALVFEAIELTNETAAISASGTLGAIGDGLPITGRAMAELTDLARYSGVASRPLQGRAAVEIQGRFDVLGGGFDVTIDGQTTDLAISEPRLDPLLAGEATIATSAQRTPEGTTLRNLTLISPAARIEAAGNIDPSQGALNLDAQLADLSLVEPKLAGMADVKSQILWQAQSGFQLSGLNADIAGTLIKGDLSYAPTSQQVSGQVHLLSPDLSTFSKITSMDLSGAIDANIDGSANFTAKTYQLEAAFTGDNPQIGVAQVDALIAGDTKGQISAGLDGQDLSLRELIFASPLLSIEAGNNGNSDFVTFQAALKDVSPLAPGFSGPFSLNGTARLEETDTNLIAIDARANGPAGLTARANGTVQDFGNLVVMNIVGSAPLGLVNGFISPNSVQGNVQYDLDVQGQPALAAVSGRLAISDGRVALPYSGIVLGQVGGTVALSGGNAQVDMRGSSISGGTFNAAGSISLASGNAADLTITLRDFGVTDPDLFETSLSGQVRIVGPIAQSARISGAVQLGTTEIMVPSSSAGLGSDIPDVKHVNAPRGVAATLNRAGVRAASASSSGNAMPLDLVVSAPNQIFVRGRGLDAELGGQLVLGGTTSDVMPSGSFELIRGRFDILGRRFVMNEGLINMSGSFDPFLRFVAATDTSAGVVRLVLQGLASAPELSFESEAGLPQEEAIAQLLFGRGLENISALQAASLVSAIATLSGRSSGGVTSRLRTALGLSDFDVTTTESGAQQFRAGAYINENIYSEITIDSEGNQAIDLNLDITPNLKAKGGTNSAGNTGIGIFFEKDY